jgi:hypothetical protein
VNIPVYLPFYINIKNNGLNVEQHKV